MVFYVVSSLDCVASNDSLMNDELERMQKEVVVA
jgi:hypothetical protein